MKEFKIRCHAIGKIMGGSVGLTDAQQKKLSELESKEIRTAIQEGDYQALLIKRDNPELPEGAKSYCQEWLKEQLYNRRKEFSSKYTEKGNIVEDNSLDFIAKQMGFDFLFKNLDYFEDDYMTGTPDALPGNDNLVIDAKNSWDAFTFPLFDKDIPTKDYYWQGQGYMHLTGRDCFVLAYVLSDTPMHLIEREARQYCYNNGIDFDDDILSEFELKMTYHFIPDKLKIKTFSFTKNQEDINAIIERVKMCRDYINTLIEQLQINEKCNI